LYYISLQTLLKEYILNYNLQLEQPYNHVNQHRHFTLRLMLIKMLISTNIASIRLIKHTKDADKAENKAYTEKIVQGIYITKENIKKVIKEIKYFNKRSVMSVIS
jgi:hypothetical protein